MRVFAKVGDKTGQKEVRVRFVARICPLAELSEGLPGCIFLNVVTTDLRCVFRTQTLIQASALIGCRDSGKSIPQCGPPFPHLEMTAIGCCW